MASAIDFVNRVAVLAVAGSTVGLGGNEQHVVEGQTETDELLRVGERVERVQRVVPRRRRVETGTSELTWLGDSHCVASLRGFPAGTTPGR